MANLSKYQSITDAVVRIIGEEKTERLLQLEDSYFDKHLRYSEELDAFNQAATAFPIIAAEINSAKLQWINSNKQAHIKVLDLKPYVTYQEEELIKGKIALFTDEQLSNLTIEELASLVKP